MDLTTFYQLISAKGKLVMQQKRKKGETMHLAPLGYRNVHRDGKSLIEPDPETYPLVQDAKLLRASGNTLAEVCKIMAARGLRSQRGKVIGPSSMLRIMRRA